MTLGYTIIKSVFMLAIFCLIVTLLWERKANSSITSLITDLVISSIAAILAIPLFILEIMLGKLFYVILTIVVFIALIINCILCVFDLDEKKQIDISCCNDYDTDIVNDSDLKEV